MDTFTLATPPKNMKPFWQGEIFYRSDSKKYGIIDESGLCRMFGYSYIHEIREIFWGAFTLIPKKR